MNRWAGHAIWMACSSCLISIFRNKADKIEKARAVILSICKRAMSTHDQWKITQEESRSPPIAVFLPLWCAQFRNKTKPCDYPTIRTAQPVHNWKWQRSQEILVSNFLSHLFNMGSSLGLDCKYHQPVGGIEMELVYWLSNSQKANRQPSNADIQDHTTITVVKSLLLFCKVLNQQFVCSAWMRHTFILCRYYSTSKPLMIRFQNFHAFSASTASYFWKCPNNCKLHQDAMGGVAQDSHRYYPPGENERLHRLTKDSKVH